ncbi:MAG TPA: cation:proton antiporter, partial [Polyangiaceae bacterium]
MSGAAVAPHAGFGTHAKHALLLAGFGGLMFFVTRAVPDMHGGLWTIAAIGFLLLAGTLTSELLGPLGLPHLTGYLIAGIASGPYLLRLVDEHTVKSLSPVNTLALSLIALTGGAELDLGAMRKASKGLAWAMLTQCVLVLVVVSATFFAARSLIPFARGLAAAPLFGVALLWGALAVTRSPSATLGILSQTRASGPLATFTLAFVMVSDVVVVILLAAVFACVRPLLDPSGSFSFDAFVTL